MTTANLTLENFTAETGFRFRVSKNQAARIAITSLDDLTRSSLIGMSSLDAADIMTNSFNAKGVPFNWVNEVLAIIDHWDSSMSLTREQAFDEFINNNGLERLRNRNRNPETPDSIYLDPDLTVSNFSSKVETAIGIKRRFRMSGDQNLRFKAGNLTREQALAEVVASKTSNPIATEQEAISVSNGIQITDS